MQMLNPQSMPLVGQSLIEASAGTGKTYTITGLYLRCLLGLQVAGEQSRALNVEQILVVTFTEAATQEIKDRVRTRIIQARDTLLGEPCHDELIVNVLQQVEDKNAAFHLLDAAAKSMDEAAIFTIHGFCQRMLKQHAFESNVAFNLEFILEQSELIDEAIKDHWRSFIYPLDKDTTHAVLEHFSHPGALASKVTAILSRSEAKLTPVYELDDVLAKRAQYQSKAIEFKAALLKSDFFSKLANSNLMKNKAPGRVANIEALIAYCQSEEWFFEFGTSKHSFNLWETQTLSDSSYYKKNKPVFTHPMTAKFSEMATLHLQVKQGLPLAIVQHFSVAVKKLLIKQKQQQGLITPDDLLTQLHTALTSNQDNTLSEKIAQQYPVAMIDEFQDTDSIQYGIFNRVYKSKNTTLVMIGDPKQAIYGFRGADIFTYIDAKNAVDKTAQYTLATNFRSSSGVVNVINSIFSRHSNSFIFNESIPFIKVNAKGKSTEELFHINKKQSKSVCFSVLMDESPITSKGTALPRLGLIYAGKISRLMNQAQKGEARLDNRAVRASDICVLVRDRNEAATMKHALQQYGIASVYLARDSVFKQPICQAILQFLTVLHGSYNESALRGVLVSPLFGLDYQTLYTLRENELQWQQYLDQFMRLQKTWHKQGAMAMLEQLLIENQLASLWQANQYNVERWLTDYRHLAELLQQKQIELDGTLRVIRWLAAQCSSPLQDAAQVRLESDANLVKIVTMHASKGLEYPIVFMPFATTYREATDAIYHHQDEQVYNLAPTDIEMQYAQKERLAEDIRLLYVALTRAVHHCDIGLYNVGLGRSKKSGITQTALGFVLFENEQFDSAQCWHERLKAFCDEQKDLKLEFVTDVQSTQCHSKDENVIDKHELAVKHVTVPIQRDWRATSFSQLSYHHTSDERPLGAIDENHQLDIPNQVKEALLTSYTFPKGAKPGSCLHEIFELIDFTSPYQPSLIDKLPLNEAVEQSLAKYRIEQSWQTATEQWIIACLKCVLSEEQGLSLSVLKTSDCLVEMEFYLPLKPINAAKLSGVLTQITGQVSHLQFEQVQGLLKGFIDLIFIKDNKYYVLDYKSNYLGDKVDDYQYENLNSAMHAHHYHLQYLIYSVALHRLLKQRVPNYDPELHLGGVYYLFLRAMPEGEGVFFKQLSQAHLQQLDNLFVQGAFL